MAKQDHIEDFEAIFHHYKDMVFKSAYLVLGDAREAEDVLQEVFIKVYRSGDTIHPQERGFKAWLHRVTVNQCISERRRKHLHSFSYETLNEEGYELPQSSSKLPDELAINQEESERIQRAMKRLDKKHRAILTLRYFDDLSYAEIAQVLTIPLGTVKSRLNAATKSLREELVGKESSYELQRR